jgi:hypothetical protein
MRLIGGRAHPRTKGRRFKAGVYGAVTLWCVKDDEGTFITFNRLRIAKQSADRKTWEELVPGWTVTPIGRAELWVRHQNAEGVVVSLHGGWFR